MKAATTVAKVPSFDFAFRKPLFYKHLQLILRLMFVTTSVTLPLVAATMAAATIAVNDVQASKRLAARGATTCHCGLYSRSKLQPSTAHDHKAPLQPQSRALRLRGGLQGGLKAVPLIGTSTSNVGSTSERPAPYSHARRRGGASSSNRPDLKRTS